MERDCRLNADAIRVVTANGRVRTFTGTLDIGEASVLRVKNGIVTTVAGVAGEPGNDARHLNRPAAVLVHAGRLWIADLDNHRICTVPLGVR